MKDDKVGWYLVRGVLYRPLYTPGAVICIGCAGYRSAEFTSLCDDLPNCSYDYVWVKALPLTKRIRHPIGKQKIKRL